MDEQTGIYTPDEGVPEPALEAAEITPEAIEGDVPTQEPDEPAALPPVEAWKTRLAEMDHDERVDATLACLERRGTFRDILYGLLGFCEDERSYEEIEPFVEAFPDFIVNHQEARRYVFLLLRTGALEEIELGEDGEPLTDEDRQAALEEGLDPQDLDTLVFDWRVVTTDAGREAREAYSPAARLERLLSSLPEREEAFAKILEFCRQPRTIGAIDDAYKGKDFLGIDPGTKLKRQPSSYLDKLQAAGAVQWNGSAWIITDTGEAYLEARAS